MNHLSEMVNNFWNDEEGMGTLEVVLICAVLIGIALMFKGQLKTWLDAIFLKQTGEINKF